ncbi:hypothetical protein HanRHA438_Chr11g0509481 [Helianthus annuus]|uniref:Uncharacterized protein n=1 Tax=Helianthus annuus TaxID=4232 RepID=A0A9K3N0I0_HELAN|nr:uncharacterized protein LOC110934609 [Helianthus annuus]KAF5782527.1 hypothetical protein HanXRQr2_Chr11g0496901 [Helianthus annuus]KAJ0502007.1 hypothetical protein HanHA300_Chr11g0407631 [Helianthus annuus]KAJ0509956.1 hypothetical protein HanIR_Chr11g0535011 [Helianthus annuus]KAJ0517931.1 hypothetical protein HanHA89_Chr11g0431331 [Helianthus annuus]KAJ0685951.1 hypothetical protein HanLR1_Chr11g0408871 [Helianthus annuus]
MGDLTTRVYTGAKRSYWRRRGYRRLATDESQSRWSWVRMPRRLKIKLRCNPKKLVARVHDAYVKMTMKLANSQVVRGGAIAGYGAGGGIYEFGMRPIKEYDAKMIIQMYKSLSVRPEQPVALEVDCADPDNLFAVTR